MKSKMTIGTKELRSNLATILNELEPNEVIVIKRKNGDDVVLVNYKAYQRMKDKTEK